MSPPQPARPPTGRSPILAALIASLIAFPALAQDPGEKLADGVPLPHEVQHQQLKEMERTLLWKGARRRFARAEQKRRELKAAKRGKAARPGQHATRATGEDYAVPENGARHASPLGAQGVQSTQAVPGNVRVNNPSTDTITNAAQSEESIAFIGNDILVSWNDGEGTGNDYQGYGYSVDGGATFTDGGLVPKPPGYASWTWQSDPVMTVNEKTGRFYYCGMADPDNAGNSALGVAIGHFTPTTFVWDTVVVVRSNTSGTQIYDKEWIVADSSSHYVYVTNSTFTTTANYIDFYRSSNDGVTWSAATQISQAVDNGYVQGSRPTVGPGGELYVTWKTINRTNDADDFKFRKSTNHGTSFGTEIALANFMDQFGTGSPGFNRERGIGFPSIAVDRSTGPHRGRIYVTWGETWDIQAQTFTLNSGQAEIELNNSAGTATAFTPGQTLRGYCSYNNATYVDLDYFKCTLNAGESVLFWADSLPAKTTYTLRLIAAAPDSAQRLAFGGELDSTVSVTYITKAFYAFRAPVTGTYHLRMAPAFKSLSRPFRYRIRTAYGSPGTYRARDQRDICLTWSDDGTTWGTPVRLNDNAIGFDDFLPEVAVGPDGCPYVTWYDYRDDTYGSRCHQYAARSTDGGATWQANARFTSAASNFTTSGSNLAPNMGDYSSTLADDRYVRPVWADGRNATSVDVWETAIDTWHTLTGGPANRDVVRLDVVNLAWTVNNLNPLFANDYSYTPTDALGWPMPAPGTLSGVTPAGSGVINLSVTVPDTASLGPDVLTLTVKNPQNTIVRQSTVTLNVTGPLAVEPGTLALALSPVRPNPASGAAHLRFTLPREGRVTLRIYGLRGELVRTVVDGERAAGANDAAWDGRDQSGRVVGSGAYFVRLEAAGRALTQRMVWMR